MRGWQWLAMVVAEADSGATGATPDAKDKEAGGGEVDKLIPSFIFVKSVVSFLLTLSLISLLGANLVIHHGVSQTLLSEFLALT